jgi:hypothetical protein
VPAGQAIPVGQWVERPNPGPSFMPDVGGKHGRALYHPGLKSMVFGGGDWHTSQPQYSGPYHEGTGSEIWSLDIALNKWTLLRPFCVSGAVQPGRPDTVGWAYDSKRNVAITTPGFYFITQGGPWPNGPSNCSANEGWGGYAFDFASKTWKGPDAAAGLPAPPGGWGGDSGASFGVYNPSRDEFVRVYVGPTFQRLNLTAGTWTQQNLSIGDPSWNPIVNRAQLVIDVAAQNVYFVDSQRRLLIQVKLADGSVTTSPLPASYAAPPGDHEVYLAFDPINRVLFVPNNPDMGQSPLIGLGIYHVDSGQWEWEAVPPAVFGSVWGFDENTGALIGIGKRVQPSAYFLYKYK